MQKIQVDINSSWNKLVFKFKKCQYCDKRGYCKPIEPPILDDCIWWMCENCKAWCGERGYWKDNFIIYRELE